MKRDRIALRAPLLLLLFAAAGAAGCQPSASADSAAAGGGPSTEPTANYRAGESVEQPTKPSLSADSPVLLAHLARDGDPQGLAALRRAFAAANPGYDLEYHQDLRRLSADDLTRVVFVQGGETTARVDEDRTDLAVGDIVTLRPGSRLEVDGTLAAVVFTVPEEPASGLPAIIRPDWDPLITDTPGGCATETGAYRRILLTWLRDNGPYTYHAINAHRVRITDSFTHYHPQQGGFDELYLVQMSNSESRLLTSHRVAAIEQPETLTAEEAGRLFSEHRLEVGDLVYLPRGVAHRGLGGVLAQVITVPGFRPGAEIGLDHHLLAANERLGLSGDAALPYHAAASGEAVVK